MGTVFLNPQSRICLLILGFLEREGGRKGKTEKERGVKRDRETSM